MATIAALVICLTVACAGAQFPPSESPDYSGPAVHADRKVTFRLRAPQAREVLVWGDWMTDGTSSPLKRISDAEWSVTLGPLKAGICLYAFAVDGVRLPDPRNRRVKNGYPGISSILDVAEAGPTRRQYGTVHVHSYDSRATGSRRRLHVYTPPGFRIADRGLPVLILLHGSWDSDADWADVGRAPDIVDSLLAEGKATPMIIAMLDGHPLPTFDASTRQRNLELLEQEIVSDVIPLLEQKYSVSQNWQDRAIAGLSMGGAQALHIGFRRWEMFGAIAAMSAPGDLPSGPSFESVLRSHPHTTPEMNQRLLWLACGRSDPLFDRAREVHAVLDRHEIRNQWIETAGAHTWTVWREHLRQLLPVLFPKKEVQ
jgi:enterochelin esterase-like enzyme